MPPPGFLYQRHSAPYRLIMRSDFNITAGADRAVDFAGLLSLEI
jgi:hypothetical protein